MANVNAPFGFRPVGKMGSNINNSGTNVYPIADNYATSIFKGDVVQLVDGVIEVGTATSTKNIGIFNGVFISKDPSTGKPKWSNFYSQTNVATGETIEAYVYDDPNQLYEVQMGGTATLAAAALGNNIDSVAGSGSTINGQSTSTLATSITGSGRVLKDFKRLIRELRKLQEVQGNKGDTKGLQKAYKGLRADITRSIK